MEFLLRLKISFNLIFCFFFVSVAIFSCFKVWNVSFFTPISSKISLKTSFLTWLSSPFFCAQQHRKYEILDNQFPHEICFERSNWFISCINRRHKSISRSTRVMAQTGFFCFCLPFIIEFFEYAHRGWLMVQVIFYKTGGDHDSLVPSLPLRSPFFSWFSRLIDDEFSLVFSDFTYTLDQYFLYACIHEVPMYNFCCMNAVL